MDPSQPCWLFFLFGHVLDLQIPIVTGYGYLLNTPILLSLAGCIGYTKFLRAGDGTGQLVYMDFSQLFVGVDGLVSVS